MTVDQRLEFLLQSTESLHTVVQEQLAIVSQHTVQLTLDAENIRALARIAGAHERRPDDLEGGG